MCSCCLCGLLFSPGAAASSTRVCGPFAAASERCLRTTRRGASCLSYHISHITHHTSYKMDCLSYHTSHIILHTKWTVYHITHHTSYFIQNGLSIISHITHHTSYKMDCLSTSTRNICQPSHYELCGQNCCPVTSCLFSAQMQKRIHSHTHSAFHKCTHKHIATNTHTNAHTGHHATPSPASTLYQDLWKARASAPDIVALGFQEIVPLSAGNVVVGEHLDLLPVLVNERLSACGRCVTVYVWALCDSLLWALCDSLYVGVV